MNNECSYNNTNNSIEYCSFPRYKENEGCILHCKKTKYENDFDIKLFEDSLLEYCVRCVSNNSDVMIKNATDKIKGYLSGNKYDEDFNEIFHNVPIDFYGIEFPEKYDRLIISRIRKKFFNKCIFNHKLTIEHELEVGEGIEGYIDCTFNDDVIISENDLIKEKENQTIIKKNNDVGKENINLNYLFSKNFKKNSLSFINCKFKKYLTFDRCKRNFVLEHSRNNKISEIHINNCNFVDSCNYSNFITDKINLFKVDNSIFYIPFIFNKININKFLIKDSIFKSNLDLSNSSFHEINFIDSKFEDNCYISDIKFNSMDNKPFLFDINKCYFNKTVDFGGSNLIGGLKIERTFFLSEVNFKDCKINDNKTNRETYRLIKNSLDKNGDIIEANKYFVEEMKAYNREISWKKNPAEKLLLNFNKIISNFGSSYIRPLLFIIISMIIYSIIVFEFDHRYVEDISNLPLYKESIFSCNLWNNIAKNFSYFNFKLKPGMEFISLLFYIFWGICTWHLIVAVKRHTKR